MNRDLYWTNADDKQPIRKLKQCTYRLLDMIFSDEFAGEFGFMGNTPIRAQLDSGDANNNHGFWICVEAAFKEPHPIYDEMQFPEDKILTDLNSPINLGENIQPHGWKKLI